MMLNEKLPIKQKLSNIKVLIAIVIGTIPFTVSEVSASTIILNGTDYEITTFNSNEPLEKLMEQPWWGSSEKAELAALTLGDSLGLPNPLGIHQQAPYFAYGVYEHPTNSVLAALQIQTFMPRIGGTFNSQTGINTDLNTFAIVAEKNTVPEPITILGAGTAIAFGAGFKRKIGKAKKK